MVRTIEKLSNIHSIAESLNKVGLYRDILHFYGHDYSLPFVYGISNLFGFTFYQSKINSPVNRNGLDVLFPDYKLPDLYASGNYFFCLNNALRATNVWCQRGSKSNKAKFFNLLKTYISEGRPIHLVVEQFEWFSKTSLFDKDDNDLFYYYTNLCHLAANKGIKLGDYHILCIGFNDESQTVKILDYFTSEIIEIHIDCLYNCTSISEGYIAPANKWFVYYVPPELPEKKVMVRSALKYTINSAFSPFNANSKHSFGLKGLKNFSYYLRQALNMKLSDDLLKELSVVLISSSSINSMMDFNRMVFGEFLLESSEIIKNNILERLSSEFKAIALNWNQFFNLVYDKVLIGHKSMSSSEVEMIDTIFKKEKEALVLLQNSI
jgi:hypothetical protein